MGGGEYIKWLARGSLIGAYDSKEQQVNIENVSSKLDFIVGASMLVRKDVICNVGLMSEDYFLYFEEIDWALRLNGHYALTYASRSIVYHKEGASIGTSSKPATKRRSKLADYYSIRNRLLFTRLYFPEALPTVYLSMIVVILNRILRRQWDRVFMILKILYADLRKLLPECLYALRAFGTKGGHY